MAAAVHGASLDQFGKYILLSNFGNYVELFARRFGVEVLGRNHPMQSATAENLTILNFGMGSAMAATVMDLLAAVEPQRGSVSGQVRGAEEDQGGRLHPADCGHSRARERVTTTCRRRFPPCPLSGCKRQSRR